MEGIWAGALPLGWFFPSAASVDRGKRRPHPPPAAGHCARHMLPVPRHSLLRGHPSATSALTPPRLCACTPRPWAPGQAAHVDLHLGRRPPMARRGLAWPRPSVPRLLREQWIQGLRALPAPAGPYCFATCYLGMGAGGGGEECPGRPGWRRGRFLGKGGKCVSPSAHLGIVRMKSERNAPNLPI